MAFQGWQDVNNKAALYLLTELHELFSDPSKWISWPLAINAAGEEVNPRSPDAVAWSLMGASTKLAQATYPLPIADFIDCAVRDFLNEISDNKLFGKMLSYDDEYALICLALEHLELNKETE